MMKIGTIDEVYKNIEDGVPFSYEPDDASFTLVVTDYAPYVCTAIHAGSNLRKSIEKNCLLAKQDRGQEEDLYTGQLVTSFPIYLVANDSRYEYDLNRSPENCVYEDIAWDKTLWKKKLPLKEVSISRDKHNLYYRVFEALLKKLSSLYGKALVFDLHSYNWQIRKYQTAPTFNVGTHFVNKKWNKVVAALISCLKKIELPNIVVNAAQDIVFQGRGYQSEFANKLSKNILNIPLEIKKIYMDEISGEDFPLVLEKLQQGLHDAIIKTATEFAKTIEKNKVHKKDLLPSDIDNAIIKVDRALFKLVKGLETLNYVNPINAKSEKNKFLSRKDYTPEFRYRQLRVNPFSFREELYNIPVSEIQEPNIRELYRRTVDNYAGKIELLTNVGKENFLYSSLKYYAEPNSRDIENAKFIIHAKDFEEQEIRSISATDALPQFIAAAKKMDIECNISLSDKIVAKAMVDNSKRALLINKTAVFSKLEISALIYHEIGVHLATTLNALEQPLFIFRTGLPGNTYTQEGVAILSEYLSGCINLNRLKLLSLRVIAVNMMLEGLSFGAIFNRLHEEYNLSVDDAFSLTIRVFRGGGFTKDYLYLRGFRDLLSYHKNNNIIPLLIGKTGLEFHTLISELLERKILTSPTHVSNIFMEKPSHNNQILDYLLSCLS